MFESAAGTTFQTPAASSAAFHARICLKPIATGPGATELPAHAADLHSSTSDSSRNTRTGGGCDSRSSKTCPLLPSMDLTRYSGDLPKSGLMLNGIVFPQPRLVRSTFERGSSYLPTLVASDCTRGSYSHKHSKTGLRLCERLGGRLNPDWCEWFMGFPIKYSALEGWETPLFPPSLK